jgi:hypothetical protein
LWCAEWRRAERAASCAPLHPTSTYVCVWCCVCVCVVLCVCVCVCVVRVVCRVLRKRACVGGTGGRQGHQRGGA